MAQLELFENANSKTVKQFPYLLEVQSNLFADANRAVYIPLVRERTLKKPDKVLNVALTIAGKSVRLFPLDISSAPRSAMGKLVGHVRDDSDSIVAAMDLLFARY
jgi:toxin CcdB